MSNDQKKITLIVSITEDGVVSNLEGFEIGSIYPTLSFDDPEIQSHRTDMSKFTDTFPALAIHDGRLAPIDWLRPMIQNNTAMITQELNCLGVDVLFTGSSGVKKMLGLSCCKPAWSNVVGVYKRYRLIRIQAGYVVKRDSDPVNDGAVGLTYFESFSQLKKWLENIPSTSTIL